MDWGEVVSQVKLKVDEVFARHSGGRVFHVEGRVGTEAGRWENK